MTVLPNGTPTDGVLWEGGDGAIGSFLGIRDSGTYLRLRAGNGANSYGWCIHADNGLALLDVQVRVSQILRWWAAEITWEIRIGGTVASGNGRVNSSLMATKLVKHKHLD